MKVFQLETDELTIADYRFFGCKRNWRSLKRWPEKGKMRCTPDVAQLRNLMATISERADQSSNVNGRLFPLPPVHSMPVHVRKGVGMAGSRSREAETKTPVQYKGPQLGLTNEMLPLCLQGQFNYEC